MVGLIGQVLIKGAQRVDAATGHQASDRQRPIEKKREGANARWGRTEHIDRKLDLGNISSTVCRSHVLAKCGHISGGFFFSFSHHSQHSTMLN